MTPRTRNILLIIGFIALLTSGYMAYKYFTESEFDSPATPDDELNRAGVYKKNGRYYLKDSGKKMKPAFLAKLDAARGYAGVPFNINSGYRSTQWEKYQNRSGKSAHTLGVAADVAFNTTAQRDQIIKAAIKAGITRIGFGANFVHLDIADSIDPVLYASKYWGYGANGTTSKSFAPFDPFAKYA